MTRKSIGAPIVDALRQPIRTASVRALAGSAAAQIHLVGDEVRREALNREARIERGLMVPMRDGVGLATRVYIPKSASAPVPAILWRSPYTFSENTVPNPDYSNANLKFALDAIRHGYAFVMQNERGKFFSEGDWDFTAKLLDVEPDGTSWNLDETIQRARYRAGYDREVFLEDGEVVELRLGPLATSNVFHAGHRIRLEVSSSNFPRFARNLNTGGDNARATEVVVARNAVHHGPDFPSRIVLTTVPQ